MLQLQRCSPDKSDLVFTSATWLVLGTHLSSDP